MEPERRKELEERTKYVREAIRERGMEISLEGAIVLTAEMMCLQNTYNTLVQWRGILQGLRQDLRLEGVLIEGELPHINYGDMKEMILESFRAGYNSGCTISRDSQRREGNDK